MKRRSAYLTSLALMAATLVYAGDAARMPVAGDRLRLNALSGFESMTGSCDSVYDFSRTSVGRAIERKYIYQSDSTVYELEQGQSRVLLMRGDAAWLSSEGRPGTLMRAAAPRPMPFAVPADSMQGGFDYRGTDGIGGNLRHTGLWIAQTPRLCDIVMPEGDTIRNARLLQSALVSGMTCTADPRDSVLTAPADFENHDFLTDSIHMVAHFALFYADGLRYPLIQTEEYTVYAGGEKADTLAVGYYYSPEQQRLDLDITEPERPAARQASRTASASDVVHGLTDAACSVYPAVFSDRIRISMSGSEPSAFTVRVYSLGGLLILSGNASAGTFDTSAFTPGTYIVEVTDGDRHFTSKHIKP